jgi:P-type conjugative transfer protein TrbJ
MKKTIITITAVMLLTALPAKGPASGIPVIDVSNLGESIKHGLEQIRQFALQVQQFETELNLYKNAVLQATGIAAAAQIWQDAQRTYGQVIGTVSGLQSYVTQSRDINYWISSAQSAGSAQYSQSAGYWSTAQKTANNQLVQTIQKQQAQLTADAQTLQRLQTQGGSTAGMKQSLDVANEMNSLMASQLMAIRTLMMSEQQAVAARNGAVSNNEAIGSANSQSLLNVNPSVSQPHTGWSPIIP